MSSDKKNILLVGGAGYLGSHLRNHLSSFNVYYTSRKAGTEALELDLLNKETFKNISGRTYDQIVLLASSLKGLGTTELKEEYLNTDTFGLSQFLQFISDHKLSEKIIFISSMTVYGIENKIPVKENTVLAPLSTYGLSKVAAETIIDFYCRSNKAAGAIIRIPGIYGGERKSGFIYNTAVKCLTNKQIEIDTSALGYWETIHIDDVSIWVAEFILSYNWTSKVEIVNIGYGTKTDFIECANLIKKILKSGSEIIVKGEKGYNDFYLDNTKAREYTSVKDKYIESLENYLKTIRI